MIYIVIFIIFYKKKEKMTKNRNESQFSSKELNKILPSYILEEIDKEYPEQETKTQGPNQIVRLIKEDEKIMNCNDKDNDYMYQYQFFNVNNYTNNHNNILSNENFCVLNNNTIKVVGSSDGCNNIFVNIMNNDINKNQFCNYNNLTKDYNNINYNYNCFNINNFNCQINNNNYLFSTKKGNNANDMNINYINIIQSKLNANIVANNNYNNYNIQQLEDFMKFINNIQMPLIDFVCNSKGALELQKMLEKSGNIVKIYFIQILKREGLSIIMKNVHGNYFFQKLIKDSPDKIISNIITFILDDFIDISKDDSGTFSIQALLNEIKSVNDINKILIKIKGKEIDMIYNKNATYVIQKIVMKFPDFLRQDLNEIILQNFLKLCLDVNGICLVKNFIRTNSIENDKQKMKIIITNNFVLLAQSPFGNYAIQFLMEKLKSNELNEIFFVLNENIFKLSVQQFSSNVVEKAIEKMDEINREKTLEKLFFQGKFIFLLKNKFGKFVITKAFNYMNKELKNKFEFDLVNSINNGIYNHKDKNRIKKFLVKVNDNKKDFVNYNNINFCMDKNFERK